MMQSIWPHDHASEDSYSADKALDELRCFVVCPARPPEYWNDLFALIHQLCELIGKAMGVRLTCRRAVDIVSAGVIHPEIWRELRTADLVIADITGCNSNVMFELGVAAAWLDKERVIIIREDRQDDGRPFDINPARQIDYIRSPRGFGELQKKLGSLIQDGVARAPFEPRPNTELRLPRVLDLTQEVDSRFLWGPAGAHRRIIPDTGLEFGSLYNFRYGWISVGDVIARNVRVAGEFRFSSPRGSGTPYQPWIGVMLRSQGYHASSGHLALLRANGEVAFTQELEGEHRDVDIGKMEDFDPNAPGLVPFEVMIDEQAWAIKIGSIAKTIAIGDLPLVFSQGRVILEGQFCWLLLGKLLVDVLR